MLKHEEEMDTKDTEIAILKACVLALENGHPISVASLTPRSDKSTVQTVDPRGQVRRGKAPLVEPFTGERSDKLWKEWLSTLERAAIWND